MVAAGDGDTRDTLNRRRRDRRSSTGKRVTPQERDLLWFLKLHQHGPLPSSYLHAFSEGLRRNEKRSRDRLTDLYNEDHTPHGGPYLERPWQQFQTLDARYQDLVYGLAPSGEAALKEHGLWSEHAGNHHGPWLHRHMVACITASVELATLNNSTLTFIPQSAILARAETDLRFPVPFKNPKSGKVEFKDLIPDAVFGLEYKLAGKSSYRFFIVEADRATEPSQASTFNRKSHLRNILQYREYVGGGLYKKHLGLTANLLVLNVTTNTKTMARMMDLAKDISGTGNSYMLFRTAGQFGRYFKPPKPMPELQTGEWLRAGYPSFRIDVP